MNQQLKGVVAVVTGASRGAGKGIALALGAEGATVYVTGRTQKEGDAPLPGTIHATAEAITKAGGKGIAVAALPTSASSKALKYELRKQSLASVESQ
jgi:NAD(P)-dependent dehydrogenase (short-subunit alcohol dehydrogenase family)